MKLVFKSFLLLLPFCSVIANNSYAQSSTQTKTVGVSVALKGILIDSVTKKPASYITVALKSGKEVIKTVVTEDAGTFRFEKVPTGKYFVNAIAIGYHLKSVQVELKESNLEVDLGNITIAPQVNNLKEVAVTADRPIIKQEVDRLSYDIQADPESKVLTVLDMMRKVPLLSLDADDNIKLKGSSSYKILINGKPSSMVARSPKDVLKSMPASSIQKIEVITTPSSKYDSEGLSGIINIITAKKIDNGYNGSLTLRESGPVGGPGLGGYGTVKQNKFGMTFYFGGGIYNSPDAESSTSRTTTGENPTVLTNIGTRDSKNRNFYGGAELSYEIDTLNLITAEINPNSGFYESRGMQNYSLTGPALPVTYQMLSTNRFDWQGLDLSLNYQLGFRGNKERLLTFSYKNAEGKEPQKNDIDFANRINFIDPNYRQDNVSKSREQTMQIDYAHPG